MNKNVLSFLKTGGSRAALRHSGKTSCLNERLKTYLIGSNIFYRQRSTMVDEISSKRGLLLNFKLLNTSFKSLSRRSYSSKLVSAAPKKSLKPLSEVGIKDAYFELITVKKILKLFAILF